MKKFNYVILLSVFFMACTSNTIIKKPDHLISKNQMVDLLSDMLIASGAENIKNEDLERNVNYFPLVFEKYGIDSTRFKESNFYYTSRIDDYEEILKNVEERLKAQKKVLDKQIELKDSLKRDSLKNLRENFKKVPKKSGKMDSLKMDSLKMNRLK
ncbi:MAG: DUF4296 domain-containing protein [Bacteroidetes bacterium HGW-Bacteroidetes-3]|nr:MAG: DUF4296 domain-containing protein [Bacteroidetes bacterium HGW-Bacteroidetes-3]